MSAKTIIEKMVLRIYLEKCYAISKAQILMSTAQTINIQIICSNSQKTDSFLASYVIHQENSLSFVESARCST